MIIPGGPSEFLESKLALRAVLDPKRNSGLSARELERNIVDNLVTVAAFGSKPSYVEGGYNLQGRSSGTGFLLTTDGFVVTAYHNISNYVAEWAVINRRNPATRENLSAWLEDIKLRYAIIDRNRELYPLDVSFYVSIPQCDIALIKAVTKESPVPTRVRAHAGDLAVGDEIKLFGLRDRISYNQYGKVTEANMDVEIGADSGKPEHMIRRVFQTDAYGDRGFSGGVFTNIRGEFSGVALYSSMDERVESVGRVGGAGMQNVVLLIKEALKFLSRLKG